MTEANSAFWALTVNGVEHKLDAGEVDSNAPLLDILRDTLKLKGTRFGCGGNQCGACYVLVDGVAVAACDTPMWAVDKKTVVTVEGLGNAASPHPLQQAFLDQQAAQCGYCISGMLISAAGLLARCPHPTEAEVRSALDRNLCRCGSHNRIVRAVLAAAERGAAS